MSQTETRLKRLVTGPIVAGLNLAGADGPAAWPRYIRTTDIVGPTRLTQAGVRIDPAAVQGLDVRKNDLLVCRTGSLGTVYSHFLEEPAAFAGYLVRVRPNPLLLEPRYLNYWAQSPSCHHQIAAGAIRATVDNFNATKIANLRIPIHTVARQAEIADFLDRECDRVAQLVSTRESQRRALDDLRASLVHEATADLARAPLKYVARVVDCKHRTAEYVSDGLPLISTREVRRGALVVDDRTRRVAPDDFADLREGGRDPQPGDIIYSRNASVGVAAYVTGEHEVCMGQDVVLISRRPRDSELLSYTLNWGVQEQVRRMSIGSTFSRINVATIRNLVVPDDTPEREAARLTHLRAAFARIDRFEKVSEASISKLAEYRTSLIGEAVSGLMTDQRDEGRFQERSVEAMEASA